MLLADFIANENVSTLPSLLPMVHATASITALDILKQKQLSLTHCPVFQIPLLYFFYGRNSYQVDNTSGTTYASYAPIAFVFDTPDQYHASHAFDTGAAKKGMFERFMPSKPIDKVFSTAKIGSTSVDLQKAVSALFGSNSDYLKEKTTKLSQADVPASSFSLLQLIDLMKSNASGENFDDRRRTFEIQVKDAMPINGASLKFIIYPSNLEDDIEFLGLIKDVPSTSRIKYPGHHATSANRAHSTVKNMLENEMLKII